MVTSKRTDQGSVGELLTVGRLVPAGRDGNKVFARMLRPGEEDSGEAVRIEAGDQLVIPPGGLSFDSREIDAQSPKGLGGYAPVANSVWTWYQFAPVRQGFFLHLFSLARRIDSAHALWALVAQEREEAAKEQGIARRSKYFSALAVAEVTVIALYRGVVMVEELNKTFSLGLDIPQSLQSIQSVIRDMRHSFEHIDDRAQGRVNLLGTLSPDSLTIFDQQDFIDSSMIHYQGRTLDFDKKVLAALLECRELIMKAIDARVASGADKQETEGDQPSR